MQHTKALAAKVSRLVEAGNDSHIAARSLGITDLDDWLAEDADFAARIAQARDKAEVKAISELSPEARLRAINKRKRAAHFARLRELST